MSARRAILIAAGRGRRLGPHTEAVPKCMVQVGSRSILEWQWTALSAAGVEELIIIRGYQHEVLTRFVAARGLPARFIDNRDWQNNNVLLSLACALDEIRGPVLISYSDIIFTRQVAMQAASTLADIGLVIDETFRDIYEGRSEHPLDEAEVSDFFPAGHVKRVGKRALPAAAAHGEFIGLTNLSATGAECLRTRIADLLAQYGPRPETPFQRAAQFRNAYLTDALQDLIDSGETLWPVKISGQWREIDTGQDLERAQDLVQSQPEVWQ
jgi:choline kinase